ncbi:MAG: hypothetical protein KDD22_03595 [Bdellovibrionales bacterium]|nr:hypothetical protein [Bdellovibrionales bacterium]
MKYAFGIQILLLALGLGQLSQAQNRARLHQFVVNVGQCAKVAGGYSENACSLAVREITECAGLSTGWCSGSAVNYINCPYSCDKTNAKDCNDQMDRNWVSVPKTSKACMQEGSLRIYKGPCDQFKYYEGSTPRSQVRQKRSQCLAAMKAQNLLSKNASDRDILPGDFHGHIEIVGQGARVFHHYEDNIYPIDSPFELGKRRTLVGCMVPRL